MPELFFGQLFSQGIQTHLFTQCVDVKKHDPTDQLYEFLDGACLYLELNVIWQHQELFIDHGIKKRKIAYVESRQPNHDRPSLRIVNIQYDSRD